MLAKTLAEVEDHLPELVEAASHGEVVDIVVGGEHKASLVPPSWVAPPHSPAQQAVTPEERLIARLEEEGLVEANRHMPDPHAVDELPDRPSGVLEALFEERDENW